MCVKLAPLGCGVRVEKWGAERGGSGGHCPGPGDRQVASGAGQRREGVSAPAAGRWVARFCGQVGTS